MPDTSADTIELLTATLQKAGFIVVSGFIRDIREGRLNVEQFLADNDPVAIVYDIAVPYEENWRFFQHLKSRGACGRCNFVLTTTNAAYVQQLAGSEQLVHEIIGKEEDLAEIVRAVKEETKKRPTQ